MTLSERKRNSTRPSPPPTPYGAHTEITAMETAADDDYVVVDKGLFTALRRHCEGCPKFVKEDTSTGPVDGGSGERPTHEASKKRKRGSGLQPLSKQPRRQPSLSLENGSETADHTPISPQHETAAGTSTDGLAKPKSISRKRAAAELFVRNAPKALDWRKRQIDLNLSTVQQYKALIQAFTGRANASSLTVSSQRNLDSEDQLTCLVERFALLTKESIANAKLHRSYSSFQVIILLSYCQILRHQGIDNDTIDQIIHHINDRKDERGKLLSSALWINRLIIDLVDHGWTIYRATELFFIEALSMTNFCRIQDSGNSRFILKHLTTDDFLRHDYSDCLRPKFTIPGLIAAMLVAGNIAPERISVENIYFALGYRSDLVANPIDYIYEVDAASRPAGDLTFENLGPNSFQSSTRSLIPASSSWRPAGPAGLHSLNARADLVHQQSVLLRLRGDTHGSRRLLQRFLQDSSACAELRSDSVMGLLHLSQAANHAYNFDFCQTHQEVLKWKPSVYAGRAIKVVWDQVLWAGRAFTRQGLFKDAKCCLEACLASDDLDEAKRLLVKSHLADLYVELDYQQGSFTSFLDKAEDLVKPEVVLLRARGLVSKGFRRVLLALIEVEIQRGRFDTARILITEIMGIYGRSDKPDIVDQLGHVRAHIALARIEPLHYAESCWRDALEWNKRYNPLEEDVFTCGLIYLFIGSIRIQSGKLDAGRTVVDRAKEIIRRKRPQFLIPGVGTYLFDSAQLQTKDLWQAA